MTLSSSLTCTHEQKSKSAGMQPSQAIVGLVTFDSCHATGGGCAMDLE